MTIRTRFELIFSFLEGQTKVLQQLSSLYTNAAGSPSPKASFPDLKYLVLIFYQYYCRLSALVSIFNPPTNWLVRSTIEGSFSVNIPSTSETTAFVLFLLKCNFRFSSVYCNYSGIASSSNGRTATISRSGEGQYNHEFSAWNDVLPAAGCSTGKIPLPVEICRSHIKDINDNKLASYLILTLQQLWTSKKSAVPPFKWSTTSASSLSSLACATKVTS